MADRPRAVLIAGPTASGKSGLALTLAERTGGVIVNADSMQVYAELAILTARPGAADLARAPHRLYGHVPAREAYSAARFRAEAAAALDEADREGRPAILVGGTGLYFKTLTVGLSAVPPIPEAVRAHWRAEAERLGAAALHVELARRDPEMAARLRPADRQRVTRALEVIEATGRSLAAFHAAPKAEPTLPPTVPRFVLAPDRATLHARIDRRFEAMVAEGAVAEAAAFDALGLDPALPAARAIGVRPLAAAARGETPLATAIAAAQAETRAYAKRQETFFRGQFPDWRRLDPARSPDALADEIAAALG